MQLRSEDVCTESQLKIHLLERPFEESRLVGTGGEMAVVKKGDGPIVSLELR